MKKLLLLFILLTGIVSTVSAEDVVKIKGSWDNWTLHTMTTTDGNIYSISLTLSGTGTYQFGIDVNGTFYKNSGTMYWYNCTNWVFKTTDSNCTINLADTGSGSYTFVWDNSTKKLSVTYPNLETVYFYNNHNWSNVYVYFLGSEYWDSNTNKGSGSKGRKNAYEMTQMGTSSIYQFTYPTSFSSAYIAFLKNRQDGYEYFWDTEAVYKNNFNSSKPLYVPNTTDPINLNYTNNNTKWTAYWNTGEWHAYPTYTRSVTNGNFGTICLPFNATVEGADIFTISSKVLGPNDEVKYINLAPVANKEIAAGNAYIFKATGSTLTATLSGNYSDAIAANGMMGNISSTKVAVASGNFIVKDNKIYKAGEYVVCGQYKGYIVPGSINVANARGTYFMGFEDETTGIANVDINDNFDANAPMYNLAGQRVGKNYKGVVVVNGKKVVLK